MMEIYHHTFFRISSDFIEVCSDKNSGNYKIGVRSEAYVKQSIDDIIHIH
jgi:hypothetical protein